MQRFEDAIHINIYFSPVLLSLGMKDFYNTSILYVGNNNFTVDKDNLKYMN